MTQAQLRKALKALQSRYEARIAREFATAIDNLRTGVVINDLVDALQHGDVKLALKILNLDPTVFGKITLSFRDALLETGEFVATSVPAVQGEGFRSVFRFDVRSVAAEQWIATQSSRFITALTGDAQREIVRSVLTSGLSRGLNPRTVALDVVGRINPMTGRREGGVIGLNAPQSRAVTNARGELSDVKGYADFLRRERRDRRFDGMLRRAIDSGEPIPAADVDRIVSRYSDRLLKLRGDVIARTETVQSLNQAQIETWRQAADRGAVKRVNKVWDSAGDSRVRDTHSQLDGRKVGLRDPFTSPSGARLLFPGDTSLGAPPEEIIQCRCIVRYEPEF